MAFQYSCFISYCHGQGELMEAFIEQLKSALAAELGPLLDQKIFIDTDRLKPGYKYNDKLADAICQSVCMIVVYSPRYSQHDYCVREFEGMELVEQRRFQLLGPAADQGKGFIIPILVRGGDPPARIKSNTHYADFSRFTLAGTPDLIRNPDFASKIREIAEFIYEQSETFRRSSVDPCVPCKGFALPPATKLEDWQPPPFINR